MSKAIQVDQLCPCFGCGQMISNSIEHDGLLHPALGDSLGPNGETGCAAFDALDGSLESFIEYLHECKEALQRKKRS